MLTHGSFWTSWLISGTAVERSLLHKPVPAGTAMDVAGTANSHLAQQTPALPGNTRAGNTCVSWLCCA